MTTPERAAAPTDAEVARAVEEYGIAMHYGEHRQPGVPDAHARLMAVVGALEQERDGYKAIAESNASALAEFAAALEAARAALDAAREAGWSVIDLSDGYRNTPAMDRAIDDLRIALRASPDAEPVP